MEKSNIFFERGIIQLKNLSIRNEMQRYGLYGYEVAAELGTSETSFSRALCRREFPQDEQTHIFDAIHRIIEARNERC